MCELKLLRNQTKMEKVFFSGTTQMYISIYIRDIASAP